MDPEKLNEYLNKIIADIKSNRCETKLIFFDLNNAQLLQLAEALLENTTVEELYLGKGPDNDGIAAFVSILPRISLKSLTLSGINIGKEGVETLATVLPLTTLKSLILQNSNIEDDRAKTLATALTQKSTLISLSLGSNRIGNEGAKAFAIALTQNSSLTSLSLYGNKIGKEGAETLAIALSKNTILTSLGLNANNIGKESGAILATIENRLERNRIIQKRVKSNVVGITFLKVFLDANRDSPYKYSVLPHLQKVIEAAMDNSKPGPPIPMINFDTCIDSKFFQHQLAIAQFAKHRLQAANSRLLFAASEGDVASIRAALAVPGVDVNAKSCTNLTALQLAVLGDHPHIVKIVLARTETNLDHKDKNGRTALKMATGNHKITALLNEAFRRVAITEGKEKRELTESIWPDGAFALHRTAMQIPIEAGLEEALFLLQKGATVDIRGSFNYAEETPLHRAALMGTIKIIQLFLDYGADRYLINKKGMNAQQCASSKGHEAAADFLANYSVNTLNSQGFAPLHRAALDGDITRALNLLARPRTDPNVLCARGHTFIYLAKIAGDEDFIDAIVQYQKLNPPKHVVPTATAATATAITKAYTPLASAQFGKITKILCNSSKMSVRARRASV